MIFSKGFGILECNLINLTKITNLSKQTIHAEEAHNSNYIMICIKTIPYISNNPTSFSYSSLHSYYIQTEFNDTEEIINNTFITYVEPLLIYINHPALIQEWKLNIHAAAYEKKIDSDVYKTSAKKKIDCHDSDWYWTTSIKYTIQWFPFITIR